ncbi:MAG: DUF456 domain-containing protein [Flavobacteriales bacterium]|jgi:uncharacterized protein|nr:DUF456 domain-containing protein [Flavobacteriales bacterium]
MDILFLLLGLLLMLLGLIGAFIPVLPGPLTSWAGLLLLSFTKAVDLSTSFLTITFSIALLVWLLDYFIPALGTKKFGGSKKGIIGSTIGLILGLIFFPPLGIIIGPFVGAFIGELIHDSSNNNRALKAAFGSFIGFLFSTGLKFAVSLVYFGLFLQAFWRYKSLFLN